MKQKAILFLCFAAVTLVAAPASAELDAYMHLTGERQGKIEGGVTRPGLEGSIKVIAFSHTLTSPRDPVTGLPTGKRQHQPIRITKEVDKATPAVMNALVNNEVLQGVIEFWQPLPSGAEEKYYTITLRDAKIVSIQQEMLNNKYPENASMRIMENVSFTYGYIEKSYIDGDIFTAADKWVYSGSPELISDLNGDGFVNFADLAIMADEWAHQSRF